MSTVPPRARRLTIGAVLTQLQAEFPDVTISKIRFLEAEGLVTPERTASGYRTFGEADLERLRYILAAQRDRFWPLKVIRDALDALDRGLQPAGQPGDSDRPQVPGPTADPSLPAPEQLRTREQLRLTAHEVQQAAALDEDGFTALVTYGLLKPDAAGHFDEPSLAVARAAGALAAYGIEPRHLRPFRTAADREIGLVQQVVAPIRGRRRDGDATDAPNAAEDTTREILAQCLALHAALVRAGLAAG